MKWVGAMAGRLKIEHPKPLWHIWFMVYHNVPIELKKGASQILTRTHHSENHWTDSCSLSRLPCSRLTLMEAAQGRVLQDGGRHCVLSDTPGPMVSFSRHKLRASLFESSSRMSMSKPLSGKFTWVASANECSWDIFCTKKCSATLLLRIVLYNFSKPRN